MSARVWELGVVEHLDDGTHGLSQFINPGMPIPPEIVELCGLSSDDLAGIAAAREFDYEHGMELFDATNGKIVVGYNILGYDWPLLCAELDRIGMKTPIPNGIIDVLVLARRLFPTGSHKLGAMAERLGISADGAHRTLADCAMTHELLMRMRPSLPEDLDELLQIIATNTATHKQQFADYGYWLRRDEQGQLRVGCGKWNGTLLTELDGRYMLWALGNATMPDGARKAMRQELARRRDKR